MRVFHPEFDSTLGIQKNNEDPQQRGARLPSTGGWQWTIGAQLLRAAVTLFDAFVADDIMKGYRVIGTGGTGRGRLLHVLRRRPNGAGDQTGKPNNSSSRINDDEAPLGRSPVCSV
jgi:ribulose bisphosphate carboxylase small subunit